MRHSVAKIVMRVLGTLGGVLGVVGLCITAFVLYHSATERNAGLVVAALIPLAFSAYFLYVSYLIWFKFSPLTVKHICGGIGFCVLALVSKLIEPARHSHGAWPIYAYLGSLIVLYLAYRVASDRLSPSLFPENTA